METTNNARTGMFTTNVFNSSKVTDFEKNKIKLKKIKVNAKRTEKVLTGLFVSFTGYIFLLAIFIPYITISITSILQQYLSKWKRIFTFIQKYLYTLYSSEHSYKKRNFKFLFPGALLLVTGGTGTIIGALVMSVLTNGMNLMGIGISYQYIVRGAILILAVLFDVGVRRMQV